MRRHPGVLTRRAQVSAATSTDPTHVSLECTAVRHIAYEPPQYAASSQPQRLVGMRHVQRTSHRAFASVAGRWISIPACGGQRHPVNKH